MPRTTIKERALRTLAAAGTALSSFSILGLAHAESNSDVDEAARAAFNPGRATNVSPGEFATAISDSDHPAADDPKPPVEPAGDEKTNTETVENEQQGKEQEATAYLYYLTATFIGQDENGNNRYSIMLVDAKGNLVRAEDVLEENQIFIGEQITEDLPTGDEEPRLIVGITGFVSQDKAREEGWGVLDAGNGVSIAMLTRNDADDNSDHIAPISHNATGDDGGIEGLPGDEPEGEVNTFADSSAEHLQQGGDDEETPSEEGVAVATLNDYMEGMNTPASAWSYEVVSLDLDNNPDVINLIQLYSFDRSLLQQVNRFHFTNTETSEEAYVLQGLASGGSYLTAIFDADVGSWKRLSREDLQALFGGEAEVAEVATYNILANDFERPAVQQELIATNPDLIIGLPWNNMTLDYTRAEKAIADVPNQFPGYELTKVVDWPVEEELDKLVAVIEQYLQKNEVNGKPAMVLKEGEGLVERNYSLDNMPPIYFQIADYTDFGQDVLPFLGENKNDMSVLGDAYWEYDTGDRSPKILVRENTDGSITATYYLYNGGSFSDALQEAMIFDTLSYLTSGSIFSAEVYKQMMSEYPYVYFLITDLTYERYTDLGATLPPIE